MLRMTGGLIAARRAVCRLRVRVGLCLATVVLGGCQATSSVHHEPVLLSPVLVSREVDESVKEVWDRLARSLQSSEFWVVEADPNDRIFWVAVATDEPEEYVDCGWSRRTFEPKIGGSEVFEYNPAASTSYKLTDRGGRVLEATRGTQLRGVASVQVRDENGATQVSTDVSYVLTTALTYGTIGVFGSKGPSEAVTREITFTSAKPGVGDEEVAMCKSRGVLESRLLDLASG
jgi:hypothetical protein